ncbi:hypothetical protein [Catenulispora pinisilvae]|uniref:hypothetical protein n=1 Tax=Catenulispora pinisilvae TaxID=2705253 RepID=UPI00189283E1|nr:hypothetical protein [Catenulispora pinisilvae]
MAPWPTPRLALSVEVSSDPRATATFTVTNGKAATATLDPGDGTSILTVPLTNGTGTIRHEYSDPGHHTYTATATAACPVKYATWTALAADNPTWADLPAKIETWADADRSSETASTAVTVDVGPATIYATGYVPPAADCPMVVLDVWIGSPDTVASWTITRSAPNAEPTLSTVIYATDAFPNGNSVEDHECPLGVPVTYVLDVTRKNGTVDHVESNAVMLSGTRGCWLTSTVTGVCVPVTVVSWDTRKRSARVAYLAVAGRPDPVALSDAHLWPSGTWVLRTGTREALDALTAVLLTRLVLLRTQPASSLRTVYASVGDVSETRAYPGDGSNWVMAVQADVQEVAPIPATARQGSTTWRDVAAHWPTWAALAADMPTWQDVSEWRPVSAHSEAGGRGESP